MPTRPKKRISETSAGAPVAFIGLGAIGLPMALRVASVHRVTGVEATAAGRDRAAAAGLRVVESVSAIGDAELAVVMVATPGQLVHLVDHAIDSSVTGRLLWLIMSTVGPASVREQGARLTANGARVLDAPVTGGIPRANTGELTIFASGTEPDLAAAASTLSTMGEVHVVGRELGDAQSVKVVNQHLCAIHIAAAAEALALAERLGLDPETVLELVSRGAAGSFMLHDRGPRMLMGEPAPVLSQVGIFVKDTGLVAEAAATAEAETPILNAARARFVAAAAAGLTTRDDSSVFDTYRRHGQ